MACQNLLTSLVYSHDVVSRLSLGSVRDMARAAMWLCATKGKERPLNIVRRALEIQRKTQSKSGSREDEITWVSGSTASQVSFVIKPLIMGEFSSFPSEKL
jgi:hypothetical protein